MSPTKPRSRRREISDLFRSSIIYICLVNWLAIWWHFWYIRLYKVQPQKLLSTFSALFLSEFKTFYSWHFFIKVDRKCPFYSHFKQIINYQTIFYEKFSEIGPLQDTLSEVWKISKRYPLQKWLCLTMMTPCISYL